MSSRSVVPQRTAQPPAWMLPKTKRAVSAPALHAARAILKNFRLDSVHVPGRTPEAIPASEFNVALMIDVTTNVFRIEEMRARVHEMFQRVARGEVSNEELTKFLYDLGVAFNYLPSY